MHGSSLPSSASLVRLRPNCSSTLGERLPPSPAALRAAARAGERAHDLVADLLGLGVEVEQDARRDALVLAHEAEEDVLGADVVVTERERLAQGELEDLLGPRREGDLALGRLLARADDAHDGGAHLLDAHFESVEHARRDALLLAQQAEQQMLGADVVVLQGPRLFLREDDDLTGAFGEAFEHRAVSLPVARPSEEWRGRGAVALPSPPGPSAPRKAT